MSVAGHQSPLDLPELRFRIGQFLQSRDAVSCSQVCRAWAVDLTRVIWRTVELLEHPRFMELDQAIILKYGHHIRTLTSSKHQQGLAALNLLDIQYLKKVSVLMSPTDGLLPHAADIIRRSGATLTILHVGGGSDGGIQPWRTDMSFTDATAIPWAAPHNRFLSTLTLHCLRMSRSTFSLLLSGCPCLNELQLHGTSFTGSVGTDPFKHEGLAWLAISIDRAMYPDPNESNEPLLVHFPELLGWNTLSANTSIDDSTASNLKALVQKHCPKLSVLYNPRIGPFSFKNLLIKVFDGLHKVVFDYKNIASFLIHGLLYHKATLSTIATYVSITNDRVFLTDQVSPVSDSFREGWMIQVLLSNCHELEKFSFPFHEMDMDSIEVFPWRCPKLKDLRIRVKGLDSKESILEVIDVWRRARRNPEQEIVETGDPSRLENRVVRHLLTFPQLSTLWLGCKLWTT